MFDFEAPLDDILFSLRHVVEATANPDWDDEIAQDVLTHFKTLAERELAPLNGPGDQQGARLVNGRVVMPDGFADAYQRLCSDGWQGLTVPAHHDGMEAPPLIAAAVSEMFSGANHALQMVCNLVPGAVSMLKALGTDEQQSYWLPQLASGECLVTMCLSEPAAGSDLAAVACRASLDHEDNWCINGEKVFISGGDQNLSSSILHMVLARTESDAGLGGLSLLLCPAQTGVRVARLEDKLGLHASPTCHLVFEQAKAQLLGERGAGLAAMFTLMNHARIDVALQGVAHAARASRLSQHYAAERMQGRTANGEAARLSDHADVQHMLDTQIWLAVGTRAMCHLALVQHANGANQALLDFLTSLCKIAGSEAGIHAADLGIQVMGGYGYLDDYGMHQVWRDARVTAIYEGTNGIHARAMVTRGLKPKGGADQFAQLVSQLADNDAELMQRLAQWKSLRAVAGPERARDFASASVQLLRHTMWMRIRKVAHHHPQSHTLIMVAERQPEPYGYVGG